MITIDQLPDSPFTVRDLQRIGLSRRGLEQCVEQQLVRRVARGVYAPATVPDTLRTRAQAIALVVAPGQVVTDRTAAWIHGVDTLTYAEHDVMPPVDVCAPPGSEPTSRRGARGRTRALSARDVTEMDGLRVTTPLRTALDLWTRLAIHDAGLPAPEPQVWLEVEGTPIYRLDLAYRCCRVAVEYDGFDTHERTSEQQAHDRERRQWLREQGWTTIVIRRGDFSGERLDRWLGELSAALEPPYSNVRPMERNSRLGGAQVPIRGCGTPDSTVSGRASGAVPGP